MIVPGARPGELPVVEGTVGVRTELWPTNRASSGQSSGVVRHVYLPSERYIGEIRAEWPGNQAFWARFFNKFDSSLLTPPSE